MLYDDSRSFNITSILYLYIIVLVSSIYLMSHIEVILIVIVIWYVEVEVHL
jgi:hypothetical protein